MDPREIVQNPRGCDFKKLLVSPLCIVRLLLVIFLDPLSCDRWNKVGAICVSTARSEAVTPLQWLRVYAWTCYMLPATCWLIRGARYRLHQNCLGFQRMHKKKKKKKTETRAHSFICRPPCHSPDPLRVPLPPRCYRVSKLCLFSRSSSALL